MGFRTNISNAQKKIFLENALVRLEAELYERSLEMGIDPDTYDYSSFTPSNPPSHPYAETRIPQILNLITQMSDKLEALGETQ